MNKLRKFLLTKLAPKDTCVWFFPAEWAHPDEQYGRAYAELPDGLRLYFEDNTYVTFSTQLPNPEG